MANLGIQNNNPGNLRDPKTGAFRVFKTPQEGYDALVQDLIAKQTGNSAHIAPGASVAQLGDVWAPPSDKNVPGDWARNVAAALGVSTAYAFDKVEPHKLARAVQKAEGTDHMNIQQREQQEGTKKMTVQEFAQRFYKKYPEYKGHISSDEELVKRVLAKRPEYRPYVSTPESNAGSAQKTEQEKVALGGAPNIDERTGTEKIIGATHNAAIGLRKGTWENVVKPAARVAYSVGKDVGKTVEHATGYNPLPPLQENETGGGQAIYKPSSEQGQLDTARNQAVGTAQNIGSKSSVPLALATVAGGTGLLTGAAGLASKAVGLASRLSPAALLTYLAQQQFSNNNTK